MNKSAILFFAACILALAGCSYFHAAEICESHDTYILDNGLVHFEISKTNGNLKSGSIANTSYIVNSLDNYSIEKEKDGKIIKSDEAEDQVLELLSGSKYSLTLRCHNKTLDCDIIKSYALPQNDDKLAKSVTFKKTQKEIVLFNYSSGLRLSDNFLKNGYFHHLERGGWTRGGQLVQSKDVKDKALIDNGTVSQICFVNPGTGYTAGHYKYTLNGKYDMNNSFINSYYAANGWDIGIAAGFIGSGKEFSTEIHYRIFHGDQFNFHNDYIKLPAYKTVLDYNSPKWLGNVRFITGWAIGHGLGSTVNYKEYLSLLDKNEPTFVWPMSPWYDPMWETRGDFLDGEIEKYAFAKDELKTLKQVQEKCQGVKIGNYTWHYSIGPKSKTYNEHPKWAALDKNMSPQILVDAGRYKCPRPDILNPEYLAHVKERIKRVLDQLHYDIYYIDEPGPKCHAYPDWRNRQVINNYDWINYWNFARKTIRACGKDKIYFANAYLPITTGFDCGFLELGHFLWLDETSPNIWGPKSWRSNADRIMFAKLYQKSPETWIAPLFWGHKSIKDGRSNDPYCSNYLIGFGLKPSHPGEADAKEMGSFWNSLVSKMPYVNAAYETRGLKMIDGEISPCWWHDNSIDLEAYTLTQGENAFIPVISHKNNETSVTVSANTTKLGLNKKLETYVWCFDMLDPWSITKDEVVKPEYRNKLIMTRKLIDVKTSLEDRISIETKARPKLLSMLVTSQVPAVIYSLNKRPAQLLLSNTLDAKIEGRIDHPRKINLLKVESPEKDIEILAMAPDEWGKISIEVDDRKVIDFKENNEFGKRFILIPLSKGNHNIEIKGEK